MSASQTSSRWNRVPASVGGLLAAIGVALSAYAAHAATGAAQGHLQTAALFAFGHGVALAALAPHVVRTVGRLALWGLLAGTVLFSGSLVATHALGVSAGLAPTGGSVLIASWLLYAFDAARR